MKCIVSCPIVLPARFSNTKTLKAAEALLNFELLRWFYCIKLAVAAVEHCKTCSLAASVLCSSDIPIFPQRKVNSYWTLRGDKWPQRQQGVGQQVSGLSCRSRTDQGRRKEPRPPDSLRTSGLSCQWLCETSGWLWLQQRDKIRRETTVLISGREGGNNAKEGKEAEGRGDGQLARKVKRVEEICIHFSFPCSLSNFAKECAFFCPRYIKCK